jgi:hypothetical protein
MAVWVLTKSYEPRIVSPLTDLLRRVMVDEDLEDLAYHALIGVITESSGSAHEREALDVIWDVAKHGHGKVGETANEYLLTRR